MEGRSECCMSQTDYDEEKECGLNEGRMKGRRDEERRDEGMEGLREGGIKGGKDEGREGAMKGIREESLASYMVVEI